MVQQNNTKRTAYSVEDQNNATNIAPLVISKSYDILEFQAVKVSPCNCLSTIGLA